MGVFKRVCYSIKCDTCKSPLEDYTGELIGITDTKEDAVELALKNGWRQISKTIWKCPNCINR